MADEWSQSLKRRQLKVGLPADVHVQDGSIPKDSDNTVGKFPSCSDLRVYQKTVLWYLHLKTQMPLRIFDCAVQRHFANTMSIGL